MVRSFESFRCPGWHALRQSVWWAAIVCGLLAIFITPADAAAPTITSVSPSSGPAAGGTTVTIIGANFTGATSVTFGGTAATGVTVSSDTSITVTAPAHALGAVDVVVTTPGGTGTGTAAFSYVAARPSPASVRTPVRRQAAHP